NFDRNVLVLYLGFSLAEVVLFFVPQLSALPGILGLFVLFSIPPFEALTIRRALAVRIYRNQALGISLVAISFILFIIATVVIGLSLPPSSPGPFGTPIDTPFLLFSFLVIFYWIDSSIRTGRRADPLLRDTMSWSKFRIIAWAAIWVSIAVSSAYIIYTLVSTGGSIFVIPQLPVLVTPLYLFPVFLPFLVGAIYLPIAARRARDPFLKRQLLWFAVFAVSFLASNLSLYASNPAVPVLYDLLQIIGFLGLNLGAYSLYRSARSLSPLNKLSLDAGAK
ncbi:MAG TPA: hypothetical protein VED17_10450, partial [Nitrososphaerales archaeon]|nr:hypothetical protein [Nitrososphaerales archaeon]